MQGNPIFMEKAIALATENVVSGRGGPFGAVIVRDGEIIGSGTNLVTAIRNACAALGSFSLSGCEIYTSCEPCPMCLAAIYWSRCDAIYFGGTAADAAAVGFDDAFLYDEVKRPWDQRTIPTVNLLREKAVSSFEAWVQHASKIHY